MKVKRCCQAVVVGAAVTGALLQASAAAAADPGPAHGQPVVLRHTCLAAGDSFTVNHGTRTCTTVTQEDQTGPVVLQIGSTTRVEFLEQSLRWTYRLVTTVETTTERSQKGNQDVTVSAQERVVATSIEPLSCYVHYAFDPGYGEPGDFDQMFPRIYWHFCFGPSV